MKTVGMKIGENGGVLRRLKVADKLVETPMFTPTVGSNRQTWTWQLGLPVAMVTLPLNELFERRSFLNDAREKGIGPALDFNGVVLVDSGGLNFSKKGIKKKAEEIFQIQKQIKSDIAIVLDEVPFANLPKKERKRRIEQSIENAVEIKAVCGDVPLEAIVHGATPDECRANAERLVEHDFDMYGVSVSSKLSKKKYADAVGLVRAVREVIPLEKPIHALGCGSKKLISLLAYHGADIFDSTSYVMKAAYNSHYRKETYCIRDNRADANPLRCQACLSLNFIDIKEETHQIMYNLIEIFKENTRLNCAIEQDRLKQYLQRRLPKTLHRLL